MIITPTPLVILDIETAIGFDEVKQINLNPALSNAIFAHHPWIAVTRCGAETQRWTHDQSGALLQFLAGAGMVTGWNIADFDLPVITFTAMIAGDIAWQASINVADPFKHIAREAKRRFKTEVFYSLQAVCELNLSAGKLGDSREIPGLFQTDLERVYEHCERDVGLEEEIYRCATEGTLRLPAKAATSYSPDIPEWTFKLETMPF